MWWFVLPPMNGQCGARLKTLAACIAYVIPQATMHNLVLLEIPLRGGIIVALMALPLQRFKVVPILMLTQPGGVRKSFLAYQTDIRIGSSMDPEFVQLQLGLG